MRQAWAAAHCFVILTGTALAGPAWAGGFDAVCSRDGIDVWAVGDSGGVHRSFDGGITWTPRALGSTALHGVAARGWTVLVVGDSGAVHRSTDNGGSFTLAILPGSPHLHDVAAAGDSSAWIVGEGGTIFATTDDGATWSPQASGTTARLLAVRFHGPQEGWAVGDSGTALHTLDGGALWTPVPLGTSARLRDVDFAGPAVWAVGDDATARVSPDGVAWSAVDLKLDARSDLAGVHLASATSVLLTGGGGFLRASADGGANWTYPKNPVLGAPSGLFFTSDGTRGWVTHATNHAVSRTTDGGLTWSTNATAGRTWSLRQSLGTGSVRGSTFALNGQNKRSVYAVLGVQVYKSADRGETWSLLSTITGGGSKTNAFYVSPSDSNLMVAATGVVDRIMRSTDGGATWTQTKAADFTEYGVPLELDVNKPSDLYFGPEDGQLWTSNDFGATWSVLSDPNFRSPCDIQVVGDHSEVIWVGDGVTGVGQGQMFRSTDGGQSFSLVYSSTGSEIPMISSPHLDPKLGLATHWASGGVRRTTDMGASWTVVHPANSAWGCDFARDDPNCVLFGLYSGGLAYLSLDGGDTGTWTTSSLPGTNYAFFAIDRATVLALQGAGIYKMVNTYTAPTTSAQSLALTSPNGGEVWTAGEVRDITWSAANVGLARLEYRPHPAAAWQLVSEVTGYAGSFAWTVPPDATVGAEVRVSDGWDASPADSSDAAFTILAPVASVAPDSVDFGPRGLGTTTLDSLAVVNTGTASLAGTVAIVGDGFTLLSPAAVALAAGDTIWVRLSFAPQLLLAYAGTLTVTGNVAAPAQAALAGEGIEVAALQLVSPQGGEAWQYGSVHGITWTSAVVQLLRISLQAAAGGPWSVIADSVPASPPQYAWTVPALSTSEARVRLEEVSGALADSSAAAFGILVPAFAANQDTVVVGQVTVNTTGMQTVVLSNVGSGPLAITSVTDDSPVFNAGRSTLVIPPLGTDTLGIYFSPTALGETVVHFTLAADDPASPHTLVALGTGVAPSDAGSLPTTFALGHDGPNPFVGSTTLRYRLPERARVHIDVYNLQGRRVATLVSATQGPGEYAVPFGPDAATPGGRVGPLAAGVYFVKMQAGSFSKTYKLVLAR